MACYGMSCNKNTDIEPQCLPLERIAYSEQELCGLLRVSKTTLWRLRKRGLLRSVTGLNHPHYAKVEVERFVNGEPIVTRNY